MGTSIKSFSQMLELLPTENSCREFLEYVLWNDVPVCPQCGCQNEKHYRLKVAGEFKGRYKCKDCHSKFTITVGTIFEGSHLPLRKWFIAMFIFSAHKKGVSSLQLGRDLGITAKTAWFIIQRLRHVYNPDQPELQQ